jgi:DMSO/TMAO reductase YedYZ heme-binding membrane subunit
VALWTLVLAPAGWLLWRTLTGRLGANPVETLTLGTGK